MNEEIMPLVVRVIIEGGRNMFFDDDSDEEREYVLLEKVDNYAEHTVPNMTDRQFQRHFRMVPETFEDLLKKLNVLIMEMGYDTPTRKGFPRTVLEKEVMVTIWYLGNLESFRSVADRFGIAKSTCWDILTRISKLLLKLNQKFKIVWWPSADRQQEIQQHFGRNGLPGIVGCIDGTHIRIVAPRRHHTSYINRKSYHSVLLQGVCDHRKLFTDVYAGEAGSIHDYTMFRRSDLYANIQNGQIRFHNDSHLVGDLAYKLETFMLVGFKQYRRLTPRQQNFNYVLNNVRVTIENAFAFLKGRFRRLKFMETIRLDLLVLLIVSACILHNICILNGDLLEDFINLDEELQELHELNPRNELDIDVEPANNAAVIKRNNIMNALPFVVRRQ